VSYSKRVPEFHAVTQEYTVNTTQLQQNAYFKSKVRSVSMGTGMGQTPTQLF